MALAGDIVGKLLLDVSHWRRGLKEGREQLGFFSRTLDKGVGSLSRFIGPVGLAGAASALTVFVQKQMSAIDVLAKTSDKLNLTTEALAGLHHAGQITGVQVETLNMGLQRMVRRVAEAASGMGEAKDALRELGVDAVALNELRADEQFMKIADALRQVKNPADQVRLTFKLFDSEGVALINTLRQGSDGIRKLRHEAEQLGLTIDRDAARSVENANDTLTRLTSASEGFGNTLARLASGPIQTFGNALTTYIVEKRGKLEAVLTLLGKIRDLGLGPELTAPTTGPFRGRERPARPFVTEEAAAAFNRRLAELSQPPRLPAIAPRPHPLGVPARAPRPGAHFEPLTDELRDQINRDLREARLTPIKAPIPVEIEQAAARGRLERMQPPSFESPVQAVDAALKGSAEAQRRLFAAQHRAGDPQKKIEQNTKMTADGTKQVEVAVNALPDKLSSKLAEQFEVVA